MEALDVRTHADGVTFRVRVSPRSSRERAGGVRDGALKVALTAPAVEGAANAALIKLLAKALGVAKRDVQIVRGDRARDKTLRVRRVEPDAIRALARG